MPYSYLWSLSARQTNDTIKIHLGSYTVTITDTNGCDNLLQNKLLHHNRLNPIQLSAMFSCNGFNDASVILTVQGSVAPV